MWVLAQFPYFTCPRTEFFSWTPDCPADPVFTPTLYPVDIPYLRDYVPQINVLPAQLHALVMAAFVSIIGPFGGFFASGFKRAIKIKDFGETIPGHGGVTDRMDCQVLMSCFSYLYLTTFVRSADAVTFLVNKAVALQPQDLQLLISKLQELAANHTL